MIPSICSHKSSENFIVVHVEVETIHQPGQVQFLIVNKPHCSNPAIPRIVLSEGTDLSVADHRLLSRAIFPRYRYQE